MSWYAGLDIQFRRAREWHLYDAHGNRYTDFCQAGGAAVLGHRPKGLSTRIKNELVRGLWAEIDGPWSNRAARALRGLFGDAGLPDPLLIAFVPGGVLPATGAPGDGLEEPEAEMEVTVRLWRPFAATGTAAPFGALADILIPRIPWPLPGVPQPVCAVTEAGALFLESWSGRPHAPESPAPSAIAAGISPVHGAGLVHTISLLRREIQLDRREAVAAELFVPPGYTRCGVYLVPSGTGDRLFDPGGLAWTDAQRSSSWGVFRRRAAKRGIILPPSPAGPIIIPGILGSSESRTWRDLYHES